MPTQAPEAEQTLLHHFDDLEQQHQTSVLGMWAFLATEVMFFGGLITAYVVYRSSYYHAFVAASRHLSVLWGCINTVVLLTSSLTMALAVRASQLGERRWLVRFLVATMALGTAFLGIKAYEYSMDYEEHLIPGVNFDWSLAQARRHTPGGGEPSTIHTPLRIAETAPSTPLAGTRLVAGQVPESRQAEMFFVLYFFMTGLHAIHLIIGIALVGVMAWLVRIWWFSGTGQTQIETTGLYWHFIDIVWIFLYPLLYLIEVRS
jgi:cytochrome c oxidase subunit 3